MGRIKRPMPAEYPAMRAKHGIAYCTKHFGAGSRAVRRWEVELNGPPNPKMARNRPIPDDFDRVAPTLTRYGMVTRWATTYTTVDRWIAESGIRPAKAATFNKDLRKRAIPPPARNTPCDIAAEYLRGFGPVSKCDSAGKFSLGGTHYRVGSRIVSRAELLTMAKEKRERLARKAVQSNNLRL